MRSAVNPALLGRSQVPDNRTNLALLGNLTNTVVGGIKQFRAKKIKDELLGAASAATQQQEPEQQPQPAAPELTFQEQQSSIQRSQVDLAEQQQLSQTQEMASQKREEIESRATWQKITSNPELSSKFLDLQSLDEGMARGVAQILITRDEQKIAGLQQEAQRFNTFAHNVGQLAIDPNSDPSEVKDFVRQYAANMQEAGVPVDKLAPLMSMNNDELFAWSKQNMLLSGKAHQIAEQAKPMILSDGQQLINPVSGQVIAENEKQLNPNELAMTAVRQRGNDLREQEIELKRNKLSSVAERELFKAQDAAHESQGEASKLESVAQEYESMEAQLGSGAAANVSETLKKFFGNEDAVTGLRRRYNQVVNKKALDNLPPGSASEKDVELVFKGFLSDSANPSEVASFLRGMAKVERANAEFQQFKGEYISDNGNSRGFQKAWKENRDSQPSPQPQSGGELDQARAAIQSGAPRDLVIKRLQENGISTEGL